MANQLLDQCKITADSIQKIQGGLILSGSHVNVELPAAPSRYLYSGWQSWSLTAWIETSRLVAPLRPSIMHPREIDPVYALETRPNGSWYGAVELAGDRNYLPWSPRPGIPCYCWKTRRSKGRMKPDLANGCL